MLTLGIDTTSKWCSVALVDGAHILAKSSKDIGRGHAELLAPMIEDILKLTDTAPSSIKKISVCTGPGSFTGLRVGLSLAKGFALPHDISVIGVSALEVWAASADPEKIKTILSAADVRRGQVFWQVFKNGAPQAKPKLGEAGALETIKYDEMVGGYASGETYICPAQLAWLGMDADPKTHKAQPLYHRPPDAKLPGGKTL